MFWLTADHLDQLGQSANRKWRVFTLAAAKGAAFTLKVNVSTKKRITGLILHLCGIITFLFNKEENLKNLIDSFV